MAVVERATARVRAVARWNGLSQNAQGAVFALLAALFFTMMATIAKLLGERLDAFQIAFFRAFFALVAFLPFAWKAGLGAFVTKAWPLHLFRGVIGGAAMLCGFFSFVHLPLAEATALSFTRILFMAPLAVIFLSETVGWRRVLATLVGFAGVLVMLRPTGDFDPNMLVALTGAMLVSVAVVCVKKLSRGDRQITLLVYATFIQTLVTAIPAATHWTTPTLTEFGLLALTGAIAAVAQACFVRSATIADTTVIAPVDYVRLLFAMAIDITIFAVWPDLLTLVGAAIVVVSTLYIVFREVRLGRVRPAIPPKL